MLEFGAAYIRNLTVYIRTPDCSFLVEPSPNILLTCSLNSFEFLYSNRKVIKVKTKQRLTRKSVNSRRISMNSSISLFWFPSTHAVMKKNNKSESLSLWNTTIMCWGPHFNITTSSYQWLRYCMVGIRHLIFMMVFSLQGKKVISWYWSSPVGSLSLTWFNFILSAWISIHIHYEMWDEITYLLPNFKMQPFKFGNGWVISSHTLLRMWLLINAGI